MVNNDNDSDFGMLNLLVAQLLIPEEWNEINEFVEYDSRNNHLFYIVCLKQNKNV